MSDKVVSLKGDPVLSPGDVDAETVAELERLLERARSGEIQGMAVVFRYSDGAIGCTYGGPVTYALVGRLLQMANSLAERATNSGAPQ